MRYILFIPILSLACATTQVPERTLSESIAECRANFLPCESQAKSCAAGAVVTGLKGGDVSKAAFDCVMSDTDCRTPKLHESFSCIADAVDHDFNSDKFDDCSVTWRTCRQVAIYMGNMEILVACDQMSLGCFKKSVGL